MLRKFPDAFMLGTAISPFQVEMGKSENSGSKESDWYKWSHDETIIEKTYVSGDFPDNGPDFWGNYKQFIDYAVQMGNNSIRIGIDWARLFKSSAESVKADTSENEKGDIYEIIFPDNFMEKMDSIVDKDAVTHYKEIMEYIKSKGLKLVVTAYHWPLPLWIHDPVECNMDFSGCTKKGWASKSTVKEFGKYVYYIYNKFHEYVDIWHTINEPNIITINGYLYGNLEGFPPGISDFRITVDVLRNLAYAHNIAYKIIKKLDSNSTVGVNVAAPYFEPELGTAQNRFITEYVRYLDNVIILL
jgi:beta-galactosidase